MEYTLRVSAPNGIDHTINAIKGIRGLLQATIKESKTYVDNLRSAKILKTQNISHPELTKFIKFCVDGGIIVQRMDLDDPIRLEMKESIKKIVTYATLSDNYDVVTALIQVLESHFPESVNNIK